MKRLINCIFKTSIQQKEKKPECWEIFKKTLYLHYINLKLWNYVKKSHSKKWAYNVIR